MSDKKKPHTPGTGAASKSPINGQHHTGSVLLLGWFNLVKPSYHRQQKSSWTRERK